MNLTHIEHWLDNQTHHVRYCFDNGKFVEMSLLTPCPAARLADHCGSMEDQLRAIISPPDQPDDDG